MIPNQIIYRIKERHNVHVKGDTEWALMLQFTGYPSWTLQTWSSKPTQKTVEETLQTMIRSFEFYHRHLSIPRFELEMIEWK